MKGEKGRSGWDVEGVRKEYGRNKGGVGMMIRRTNEKNGKETGRKEEGYERDKENAE
jgi:hypothetical protein